MYERQADLSAVGPANVERQHANAPPRQVPGRKVAGFQLAPCLPRDRDLWRLGRYDDFLKERRQLLSNAANDFLGV